MRPMPSDKQFGFLLSHLPSPIREDGSITQITKNGITPQEKHDSLAEVGDLPTSPSLEICD